MHNSEPDADRAIQWLIDNAEPGAEKKAERVFCQEYRKSLKAILIQDSDAQTAAAKEADAYAHPKYVEHLEKLKRAVFEEEKHRGLQSAAILKVEVWRTQSANMRKVDV